MKVIRKEDKKSNKYIVYYDIEETKKQESEKIEIAIKEPQNLVVTMADGSKPRYLNITENEEKILRVMWQQQNVNKMEIRRLLKQIFALKYGIFTATALAVLASICSISDLAAGTFNYWSLSFPLVFTVCDLGVIKSLIEDKKKLKEVLKNEHLRENEEELNSINLDNPNLLTNIKKKQIKEINRIRERKKEQNNQKIFDINSIDNLSLETLKQIKFNIERENYLGLVPTSKEVKENDCKQYKKV